MSDDSSDSDETNPVHARLWPPPEGEAAGMEAILTQTSALIAEVEQALYRAKTHLAALERDAPRLHELLRSAEIEKDQPRLADLKAARSLRGELVKAAQQSVAVSQSASRYLQARERFLQARRAWMARTEP